MADSNGANVVRKTDFARRVAARMDASNDAAGKAIDAVTGAITDSLMAGEKVNITGFGVFETRDVGERTARSPVTKETVTVPAHKRAAFKPGKSLKDAVKASGAAGGGAAAVGAAD